MDSLCTGCQSQTGVSINSDAGSDVRPQLRRQALAREALRRTQGVDRLDLEQLLLALCPAKSVQYNSHVRYYLVPLISKLYQR